MEAPARVAQQTSHQPTNQPTNQPSKQSELLTDPQLRHPDDSVEGQLWEREQGHEDTKSQVPEYSKTNQVHNVRLRDPQP